MKNSVQKIQFRNLFAIVAFAVAALVAIPSAQAGTVELPIVQGHIQTGGSFHYYRTDDSNSDLYVAPMAEFFLLDRISIGASAGLDWNKTSNNGQTATAFRHTISPEITWYFLDLNPLELYAHQSVNFGVASTARANRATSWTTALGVSIFFAKNVAFAPQIEWHYGNQIKGFWDVAGAFEIFF